MRQLIFFFSFVPFFSFSQAYNFNKQWEFLGPDDKPSVVKPQSASGVGPIEFIRVFQKNSKNLLAGSNLGGLFFSTDGGENWINSGSDNWPYSGCGWADFYPENEKIWFAYSQVVDNNGKPGRMGALGGIYRTTNEGTDWTLIGNPTSFGGSEYRTVYGFRFHPKNAKMLFVMTDDGLFLTSNCLEEAVKWTRLENLNGWIYDLDFQGEMVFVSNFAEGKWNIFYSNRDKLELKKITEIGSLTDKILTITFEPFRKNLLILIDYKDVSDALYEYTIETAELKKLMNNQMINFGAGHSFAVSPHDSTEFIIGHSITMKKWNYTNLKEQKLGGSYHPDVEFIAYDPVDTSKLYLACHGGVYISNDAGLTWISKCKGLGNAEVMGMDVSESDPNQVVIGCYHDGSSVRADFNKDGNYFWRTVNGGDALTPLIDPTDAGIVYTSTQYVGGGLYYSTDTSNNYTNIHNSNSVGTSGWELGAVLHPVDEKLLFFNFAVKESEGKGNFDIARTPDAGKPKSAERISDFLESHELKSYKVYGIFNNEFYPDHLYAYVLHLDKDSSGKNITRHRLFKTEKARDSANVVIESWYELEIPYSSWIGDVEGDPSSPNQVFLSYSSSRDVIANPEITPGLVYSLKYNKKTNGLKREIDITENIPNSIAGRFNMVCVFNNEKELFIATRTGIYYGTAKTQKGKSDWQQVGFGLPHCKIYGLHYHQGQKLLTVGLYGRGVWRYQLE